MKLRTTIGPSDVTVEVFLRSSIGRGKYSLEISAYGNNKAHAVSEVRDRIKMLRDALDRADEELEKV